jgi:hypothetical protein
MAFTLPRTVDGRYVYSNYNIDWSVGQGCWNEEPDVALVQKLINMMYFDLPEATLKSIGYQKFDSIDTPLKIDGICGPLTINCIKEHQRICQKKGGGTVDAKIDPLYRDAMKRTPKMKAFFSLDSLTHGAMHLDFNSTVQLQPFWPYRDLDKQPDIPIYLKNELKTVQQAADQHVYGNQVRG